MTRPYHRWTRFPLGTRRRVVARPPDWSRSSRDRTRHCSRCTHRYQRTTGVLQRCSCKRTRSDRRTRRCSWRTHPRRRRRCRPRHTRGCRCIEPLLLCRCCMSRSRRKLVRIRWRRQSATRPASGTTRQRRRRLLRRRLLRRRPSRPLRSRTFQCQRIQVRTRTEQPPRHRRTPRGCRTRFGKRSTAATGWNCKRLWPHRRKAPRKAVVRVSLRTPVNKHFCVFGGSTAGRTGRSSECAT